MSKKGEGEPCPKCGFNNNGYVSPPHHLKAGTILGGKYIIGKALGEGGFGITYIGYDLNLEIRLAIKEYFPSGFVSRDVTNSDTVTVFSGAGYENFEIGRSKFINEAKALARFENLPGIVSVKDFFQENGTAYIVMEYVEGETLKAFLKRNGGKTAPENIFAMMKPLMKSLAQVHKEGIIHRDISPDNIMITGRSEVKLLDFGAARDISADGQKSLSIQLKPGYAPEEQYRTHGKQGPWTDIYALCATMYRAITGIQPMEALERLQNDTLSSPSMMGVSINPYQEQALMQGMAVYADQRFPNMEALYNAIYSVPNNSAREEDAGYGEKSIGGSSGGVHSMGERSETSNRNAVVIAVAAAGGVFVIAFIIILALLFSGSRGGGNTNKDTTPSPAVAAAIEPTPTAHPAPVMTYANASSTRGTDTEGGQYSESAVLTDDPMTKWVPDKTYGNGIGQWIQVGADSTQYVKGIKILNGYHKNSQTWSNNNRVSRCTISFSNGQSQQITLNDTMDMVDINLGKTVETTYVRLTIEDIYSGTKWNDTAITYLGVY